MHVKLVAYCIFPFTLVALQSGCKTSEDPALETIETSLESRQNTLEGSLGLDAEGKAIVQQETDAATELMAVEHVNENLKHELAFEFHRLKTCRQTLNLSRNGGSGEYPELSGFSELEADYAEVTELGLVDDDIRIVKKSSLRERLQAQTELESKLRKLTQTVKQQKERCEFQIQNL